MLPPARNHQWRTDFPERRPNKAVRAKEGRARNTRSHILLQPHLFRLHSPEGHHERASQTLGYHRQYSSRESDQPLRAAQGCLFWTVYQIDKGLSLRLSRSSNIRDAEITLHLDPNESRQIRLARVQRKVYDQLYSPVVLSLPDDKHGYMARALARELRELIKTNVEVLVCLKDPSILGLANG